MTNQGPSWIAFSLCMMLQPGGSESPPEVSGIAVLFSRSTFSRNSGESGVGEAGGGSHWVREWGVKGGEAGRPQRWLEMNGESQGGEGC